MLWFYYEAFSPSKVDEKSNFNFKPCLISILIVCELCYERTTYERLISIYVNYIKQAVVSETALYLPVGSYNTLKDYFKLE